jgi:hypothetical protein
MKHSLLVNCIKLTMCIVLLVYPFRVLSVTENQFNVHGLSAFEAEQAQMLENWLTQGVNAARATLGIYPTPLALYLYHRESNQPVPWAIQGVMEKAAYIFM